MVSASPKLKLVYPESHYRIEKGVRLPPKKYTYPFWDMVKGDSFFVPCEDHDIKRMMKIVQNKGQHFGKKYNCRFATRIVEGGVRCWRIS